MQREGRVDHKNIKLVELGAQELRKSKGKWVTDSCVELERLTGQVYPELDDSALDTEQAHLWYEQLEHW